MTEPQRNFNFANLIDAWRSARRWSNAHEDLAGFHRDRYAAFARAFGAELGAPPEPAPPVPEWLAGRRVVVGGDVRWAEYIHQFALQTEARAESFSDPWAGLMEGPPSIIATYERYSGPVKSGVAQARSKLLSMSADLLAELFPEAASKIVSSDELRAAGFDPETPEPDELDYW